MAYAIAAIAALAAGAVQTVTGFGAAVVLMLALPRIFGVVTASAVSTSICVALSGMLAWKLRHRTDFKFIALPILVFSACGVYSHWQGDWVTTCQTSQHREDQESHLCSCRHFGRDDAA